MRLTLFSFLLNLLFLFTNNLFSQPEISITPSSLSSNIDTDETENQTLTISNSGSSDLSFSISTINANGRWSMPEFDIDGSSVRLTRNEIRDIWSEAESFVSSSNSRPVQTSNNYRPSRNWRLLANDPQDNDSPYDTENIYYELTDSTLNFKYEYYENWEDPYGNTIAMIHIDLDNDPTTGANGIGFAPDIMGIDMIIYSYGFGEGFDGDGVYIFDDANEEFIQVNGIEWENREFNTNEFSFGISIDYFQGLNYVPITLISTSFSSDIPDLIPNQDMVELYFPAYWLSLDQDNGTVISGQSMDLDVTFDVTNLSDGNYNAIIEISNNDPSNPNINIPVNLVHYLNTSHLKIPNSYALHPAFPNPFNPTTTIGYDIPIEAFVRIFIYDLSGKEIKRLINSKQSPGNKSIVWDATNNIGKKVSSGIYIYTIQTAEFKATKKIVLLK